jgi:hypothetical protein
MISWGQIDTNLQKNEIAEWDALQVALHVSMNESNQIDIYS